MESAAKNIHALLDGAPSDLYSRSVGELVSAEEWSEINDRFYRTLAFGTGGLRGRTIGKIVTSAEHGNTRENERPEFPCVGTNAMNFYNISRATQGLVAYLQRMAASAKNRQAKPKIVIAHDTRFFSKEFAELAGKVAAENGCDACVFDGPRSTPELSFAVRYLSASAGVVITASHNPPHDNGYKVYFDDGAQVIEPHASGIIAKVNAIDARKRTSRSPKIDRARSPCSATRSTKPTCSGLKRWFSIRELIHAAKSLRIVFTPIHGTGGVIIKPMLERLGFNFDVVAGAGSFRWTISRR